MILLGFVILLGVVVAGGLLFAQTAHLDREIAAELMEGRER
ncbi:MAG TPA: hypothetical protein VGQ83_37575 [Polyangia bacterium]|jgi:hypothetical protein